MWFMNAPFARVSVTVTNFVITLSFIKTHSEKLCFASLIVPKVIPFKKVRNILFFC